MQTLIVVVLVIGATSTIMAHTKVPAQIQMGMDTLVVMVQKSMDLENGNNEY